MERPTGVVCGVGRQRPGAAVARVAVERRGVEVAIIASGLISTVDVMGQDAVALGRLTICRRRSGYRRRSGTRRAAPSTTR